MNVIHRSCLSMLTYFNDPTDEEVSQYNPYRYATSRTSHKDDVDNLRDSLNNSTLQFVAGMSDDELNRQTIKNFVVRDPPAIYNPYYLPALRRELANHQRAKGTC